MSASIRIESGIAAGTNYWIDRPVLRIGSDPQCEICLPTADLAPHALTLEFRGGVYRAYNRGATPVTIGRASLQPGGTAHWEGGEAVLLPGGLRLVLDFDGDPRPSPRPDSRIDDGFDEPAVDEAETAITPEAVKKAKSKSTMQVLVIAFCVVAMAGLLLMNNMGGDSASAESGPSFDDIVMASLEKSEQVRVLVQQLQFAQSLVVRGRTEEARTRFSELRDLLMRQTDALPQGDQEIAKQIREYVDSQLRILP